MKAQLIELLETFGFPVFLQGSLNSVDDYPDSFFTFWNFDNPESEFYDDHAGRCIWGFWVYFYSTDPLNVEQIAEQARQLLRANGWIVGGKPADISVNKPTHTGAMFTTYIFENYESEVLSNGE